MVPGTWKGEEKKKSFKLTDLKSELDQTWDFYTEIDSHDSNDAK